MIVVMVICVGISQIAVVLVIIIELWKPPSNNIKDNKLAGVKKNGCKQIKYMAATLHNYKQQVLVKPTNKKYAAEELFV
jgi:hypothetical protein